MPKTNDAALDAFIAAKAEIDAMLAQLSTAEEKPAKWRRKTLPLRDAGNGGWAG